MGALGSSPGVSSTGCVNLDHLFIHSAKPVDLSVNGAYMRGWRQARLGTALVLFLALRTARSWGWMVSHPRRQTQH